MIKKIIILIVVLTTWFLPAYIFIKYFDTTGGDSLGWIMLGWIPAIFVGAYLEE